MFVSAYFVRSVPVTNSMILNAALSSVACTTKHARVFTTKGALIITEATTLSTVAIARFAFMKSLSNILPQDVTLIATGVPEL